jgi:hypothetical protein
MEQRLTALKIEVLDAAPTQDRQGASERVAINKTAILHQPFVVREGAKVASRVTKIGDRDIADSR